ncbi:MAG: hypothetical protein CVV11_20040 [Gammaproteobacteria bacterium HGW-Gammaproteobacteria-15]|nr:MAG: hypothetical protein CVV11_20040 [Gammaproteobacteria bacterium HGW-Gammaproteobacteria-15]
MDALAILKAAILDSTKRFALETHCDSDEIFGRHNGVSNSCAAHKAGIDRKVLLRELHKLSKAGVVLRFPIHKGLTLWWPAGYLAELRAEAKAGAACH